MEEKGIVVFNIVGWIARSDLEEGIYMSERQEQKEERAEESSSM